MSVSLLSMFLSVKTRKVSLLSQFSVEMYCIELSQLYKQHVLMRESNGIISSLYLLFSGGPEIIYHIVLCLVYTLLKRIVNSIDSSIFSSQSC